MSACLGWGSAVFSGPETGMETLGMLPGDMASGHRASTMQAWSWGSAILLSHCLGSRTARRGLDRQAGVDLNMLIDAPGWCSMERQP